MSENHLSNAATTLTALAERALSGGYEPWLFYRDGWDWRWRSWSRVADHVARSVAVLRGAAAGTLRAGYDAHQHPDAIVAGLAIQAAGWVAVPVAGGPLEASSRACGVWVGDAPTGVEEPAPGLERVELPPALSPFDRTEPRHLVLDGASASAAVAIPRREPTSPEMLASSARRLDRRLSARGGSAIVCAAPELGLGATQLLQAWSLVRGAAWILEPEPEAFIETVLWARPTVVWARLDELEQLAVRLQVRKHRRRSRLVGIVVAGEEGVSPILRNALGVDVVTLGKDPLGD